MMDITQLSKRVLKARDELKAAELALHHGHVYTACRAVVLAVEGERPMLELDAALKELSALMEKKR